MAISLPPPAPQRGDRSTFSARVDAFLSWLVSIIPQLNSFISSLSTIAAGGAGTFAYTFDTAITDSDPGTGRLRLGSATQNGSVVLRLDNVAGNGGDVTGFIGSFSSGTSNVKASVRIQKLTDANSYLLFDITSVAVLTGYQNLTLTPRASSSANPFSNNDTVIVYFTKVGDKGDGGGTPTAQQIRDAVGTMPIANGGTGATTAGQARTNLSVPAIADVPILGAKSISLGTKFSSGAPPAMSMIASAAQGDRLPAIFTNDGNSSASATVGFRREGVYEVYFGLDTDNVLKLAIGNSAFPILHEGNLNPNQLARLTGADFTGPISAPTITQTSDERKKTNWRELTDEQLDSLAEMSLVGIFDWSDGSGSSAGGSAQQIRKVVPEAVRENEHGELSVDYGGLNFAIIQAELRRVRRIA